MSVVIQILEKDEPNQAAKCVVIEATWAWRRVLVLYLFEEQFSKGRYYLNNYILIKMKINPKTSQSINVLKSIP